MRQPFAICVVAGLLALLSVALAGCGGGGTGKTLASTSRQTGSAKITILWPAQASKGVSGATRVIPLNTASIKITIESLQTQSGQSAPSLWGGTPKTVNRPSGNGADLTTATQNPYTDVIVIDNLPVSALNVKAVAYSGPDGTGVVLASGASTITVAPDFTVAVPIDLSSAIKQLTITALNFNIASTLIPHDDPTFAKSQGADYQLKVDAKGDPTTPGDDTTRPMVLLDPAALTWASSNTDIFTASENADGTVTVTAVHSGTAQLLLTAQGSNLPPAGVNLTVKGNVTIVQTDAQGNTIPFTANYVPYTTYYFKASVTGTTNQRINWDLLDSTTNASVISGTAIAAGSGGQFLPIDNGDAPGTLKFVAPAVTNGAFTLRAASQIDPSQNAAQGLTVTGAPLNITITN